MTPNDRFEKAWQIAEAQSISHRMMQGYPAWLQRRRRNERLAVGMVAVVLVAGTVLPGLLASPLGDPVDGGLVAKRMYCHRTTQPADHWANVADEMLTLQMT